ncbi:MAG TPA: type II toxin-antitoxin system RelE/ParE family toxin [Thermoanaerobaculia bacterium]|jgi:plasmid stabilization system protein ParE|nr:type II toxin-antitoxin system RelE/ParE family toxin [Thermoanaerobaculia bacterium]
MTTRVIIRPEASADIRSARRWYRSISLQLAEDFLEELRRSIDAALERPRTFPVVYRTFRRVLLHRFPYALFFDTEEERITVVAVLHGARDPGLIRNR